MTILVLSRSRNESTTELVVEWIRRLGGSCFRLNAEDLEYPNPLSLRLTSEGEPQLTFHDALEGKTRRLMPERVSVVWYRRWLSLRQHHMLHSELYSSEAAMQDELCRYLDRELEAFGYGLLESLRHARWLSEPETAHWDKLAVLMRARKVGLTVPEALVTTHRAELEGFVERHGRVITKNLGRSPLTLRLRSGDLTTYTTEVTQSDVAGLPETFFPSLFQRTIEKRYELRVFSLRERLYPMAIFSQSAARTSVDFRRDDGGLPTRHVPYRLPTELEAQLRSLLRELQLETASVDLIRATDGRYVFLEVNPVGQFGMVSYPCNYQLERAVAEHLISLDESDGKAVTADVPSPWPTPNFVDQSRPHDLGAREDDAKLIAKVTNPDDSKLPVAFKRAEFFPYQPDVRIERHAFSASQRALGYACGSSYRAYRPISKTFGAIDRRNGGTRAAPLEPSDAKAPAPASVLEPKGDHWFVLFACNLVVHGARRSTVCDLQRGDYYFISHELERILEEPRTIAEVRSTHGDVAVAWLADLVALELGFFTAERPDRFPPIERRFERPERIADAIIDVDARSAHDYADLVTQLDELGCKALQLRFFETVSLASLDAVLSHTLRSGLRSVEVIAPYDATWNDDAVAAMFETHQRLATLALHSAPENKVVREGRHNVVWFSQPVTSSSHCGEVHPDYFRTELGTFLEAQHHNSCLHKKIGIDARGHIRNCPAHETSHGTTNKRRLELVVDDVEFRRPWALCKDQIDVCRDCELRYVCTDCRVFRQTESLTSKPAKCTYDPYAP